MCVLWEDESLVIVEKPEGWMVHRSYLAPDRETCSEVLEAQLGTRVFPIHRLDRGTSGCLVFGRSPDAARLLGEIFSSRAARKEYLVIVRGWLLEAGEIDYAVRSQRGGSRKEAVTKYEPLGRIEVPFTTGEFPTSRYTLVRCEPKTGRWHQIRQHLRHLNHHVIGDRAHGDPKHNALWREKLGASRMLLHAWKLTIPHPMTGDPIAVECRPKGEMAAACGRFGVKPAR